MGFAKAGQRPAETDVAADDTPQDLPGLIRGLRDADADLRRRCAKALSAYPESVHALAASLDIERVQNVREMVMTSLALIGTAEAVAVLLPCLRSDDAFFAQ